jgi:Spy/CpxP family protein refolding chaperone
MRSPHRMVPALAAFGLLAAPVLAQRPGGGGFGFGGPPGGPTLLLNKSVQDELKLSDELKRKLTKINEKRGEEMRKVFQDSQGDREKMQEGMKKLTDETNKAIAEVEKGLTADQTKRFKQIEVQMAGIRAFSLPEVQKALSLTDKQKTDAKAAIDAVQKDTREMMQGVDFTDREKMQETRKKIEAMTKEAFDKLTGTLSADQKKTWAELTGAKFEFKPDPFRRPGGN